MAVTQYIGARYVPILSDPLEWSSANSYEPLTIVTYQGNSYTSRQFVPIGIDIENESFWALTGNYNAQIESYRQEVLTFDNRITANTTNINNLELADEQIVIDYQAADTQIIHDYEAADTQIIHDYEAADTQIEIDYKAADAALYDDLIDYIANDTDYMYPKRVGTIRVNSGTFSNVQAPPVSMVQGLCYHDGLLYPIIINKNAESAEAYVYSKDPDVDSAAYLTTISTYHSSDIIYIPDIQEYWISKGSNGVIFRYRENWTSIGNFTIGSSATLLAYDKATDKVYANDYWGHLYEVDYTTREATQLDVTVPANAYKQSIAAHDGFLFVLFSYPSTIFKIDIATGKKIDVINLPYETTYIPMGETEGIDTDENGNIYLASYVTARNSSVYISPLWYLDFENPILEPPLGKWQRALYIDAHTDANLLTHQTPDGTESNPFPTIDEAELCRLMNQQIITYLISGDHAQERPYFLESVVLEGQIVNGNKPTIGGFVTQAPLTFVHNCVMKLLVTQANIIQGYRNGPLTIISTVTKDTSVASPTGDDVTSQYPINTDVNYTETLSE